MGGAGYIFTGENDADVMSNSCLINLNVVREGTRAGIGRLFYSSSACVYPARNQVDPLHPECSEGSVYPAEPDSEYGWEKLFSERLYLAFARNCGIAVKIARYHNIFGPECSWNDGREKVPAALCRKVVAAREGEAVEVWGDGAQTRSFLYIDDCVDATVALMRSGSSGPLNIGSEEMVSVNELAREVIALSGKAVSLKNVPGPEGVRGRCSDNKLIGALLGWSPRHSLREGLRYTYKWIETQFRRAEP
jgi:nucleoside-diphosphate-sugar epimerase